MEKIDRRKLRARFFVAADGSCWKKAWPPTGRRKYEAFVRDGGKCRYCGKPLGWLVKRGEITDGKHAFQVDHVVPRCRGGRNDLANLVSACEACNLSKGAALIAPRPLDGAA